MFSKVIIVNVLAHLKSSCQLLKGMFRVFSVKIKNKSTVVGVAQYFRTVSLLYDLRSQLVIATLYFTAFLYKVFVVVLITPSNYFSIIVIYYLNVTNRCHLFLKKVM